MGGKNTKTTQTVTIPPEVLARYGQVNRRAEAVANTPFQAYSSDPSDFVAQLNQQQYAGIQNINQVAGMAQPFYQAGAGLTLAGAQGVGPLTQEQIGYYQNPYTNAVAGTTYEALRQQQQQEMQGATANAIRSGAFGGDRAGLVAANLARQQQLGTAQALAPIFERGYSQAVQTAQGQQGVQAQDLQRLMTAGQQIGGLGAGAQQAGLAGAQAQLGAGTLGQQTEQAGLSALYNQFLQERAYPFQVAQFLANIAMGTGALSGSTTTTQQPAPFFSDERLKEDIEPIGELNDGQTVYRYKMDGKPQIGLLAQEVEKNKPEAVGLARGFKTVDYGKATEDASRGGFVEGDGGRSAYANGGSAFDQDMIQQLLRTQQGMYAGLYGQPGTPRGAQGTPGAGSIVPAANLPVGRLATAGSLPQQQQSGLAQTAQTAGNIKTLVDMASAAKEKMFPSQPAPSGGRPSAPLGLGSQAPTQPRSPVLDENQLGSGVAPAPAPARAAEVPMPPPRPTDIAEAPGTFDEFATMFAARGGRIERAAGGTIPYEAAQDYFPEQVLEKQEAPKLATAGSAPGQQQSGLGQIGDALKTGASLYGAATTLAPAVSSAASALIALLPFSDKRIKKNDRVVGETYDGQKIHAYDLGDGRTRLGLMAQEAEKRTPEAVGLAAGLKTLDYDKATEKSAGLGRMGREEGGRAEFPEEEWKRMIQAESRGQQFDRSGQPLRSPKGATGIAQVMPGTAPEAAKLAGVPFDKERYERDPAYNEELGRAYYKEQYRRFGDPLVAAAAYNAGPGRVQQAMAKAEERGGSYLSYLPTETRNYVATVSGAAQSAINKAMETVKPEQGESRATPGLGGPGRGPSDAASAPLTTLTKGLFKDMSPEVRSALTSENFWVPLVTGVGTMLASKSPFLGGAVGEGLVGGVQAYTGIQKQQQELGESRARTEEIVARTAGDAIKYVGDRLFVRYIKPGGGYDFMPYNEWLALDEKPQLDPRAAEFVRTMPKAAAKPEAAPAPSAGRPAAPAPATTGPAAPAPATPAPARTAPVTAPGAPANLPSSGTPPVEPAPPIPPSGVKPESTGPAAALAARPSLFTLSPEQTEAARKLGQQRAGWSMARVNTEPDFFTPQDEISRAIADQKQLILPLAGTLADLPRDKSISVSGKFQEVAQPVMAVLNNLAAIAGKPDLIQDPSTLAKQEEVRKLTNQLQQTATTASQQRAFAAFKEMAEGIPGIMTSPGGQAKLVAQILTNAQSQVDKNEFFSEWAKAAGGNKGQFSEFAKATSREAEREFNKKFTNSFYTGERRKLEQMFNDTVSVDGKPMPILYVLSMRPDLMNDKRKSQIEREYGTGILRYFGIN